MRSDCQRAKQVLECGEHSCVLCRGEDTVVSDLSGIAPMLGFLQDGRDLRGYSAADKIVGKAAAMLFVLAGAAAVYASVMSETGRQTLERFGVAAYYDQCVPVIFNRQGTGACPMEQAVSEIADPTEALRALKEKRNELREQAAAAKKA